MKVQLEEEDKGIFWAWASLQTFIWLATIYIFTWLLIHYQSDSKLFWVVICVVVLFFDTVLYMLYTWQWLARKLKGLRPENGPKFALKKEPKIKDRKRIPPPPSVKDLQKEK